MHFKKGHLIEYKNSDPVNFDYMLGVNIGTDRIWYFMHESRILMGLTVNHDDNRGINPLIIK